MERWKRLQFTSATQKPPLTTSSAWKRSPGRTRPPNGPDAWRRRVYRHQWSNAVKLVFKKMPRELLKMRREGEQKRKIHSTGTVNRQVQQLSASGWVALAQSESKLKTGGLVAPVSPEQDAVGVFGTTPSFHGIRGGPCGAPKKCDLASSSKNTFSLASLRCGGG